MYSILMYAGAYLTFCSLCWSICQAITTFACYTVHLCSSEVSWLFLDICFHIKFFLKSFCWNLVTTAQYFLRLLFSNCCLCMETQLTLLILYLVTWVNYFINFNNLFADFGGVVLGRHKYCLQIMKIYFSLSNLYIFLFSLIFLFLVRFFSTYTVD